MWFLIVLFFGCNKSDHVLKKTLQKNLQKTLPLNLKINGPHSKKIENFIKEHYDANSEELNVSFEVSKILIDEITKKIVFNFEFKFREKKHYDILILDLDSSEDFNENLSFPWHYVFIPDISEFIIAKGFEILNHMNDV